MASSDFRPKRTSNFGWGTAVNLLRLTEKVSGMIPIPILSGLVGTALHIAETAESVKSNKEGCRDLADRAATLTAAVYDQILRRGTVVEGTEEEMIKVFLDTLEDISSYMTRLAERTWSSRLIAKSRIKEELTRYGQRLDDAATGFGIVSHIQAQQQFSHLKATLERISAENISILERIDAQRREISFLSTQQISAPNATHDGDFKLYGRGDIELLQVLHERETKHESQPGKVVVYWARVDTKEVIVRRYPRGSQQFEEDLIRMKNVWHPNIAQLIGYSRKGSGEQFYVTHGSLGRQTVHSFTSQLQGSRRIAFALSTTKQIFSVFHELSQTGILIHPPHKMINNPILQANGQVLLDFDDPGMREGGKTVSVASDTQAVADMANDANWPYYLFWWHLEGLNITSPAKDFTFATSIPSGTAFGGSHHLEDLLAQWALLSTKADYGCVVKNPAPTLAVGTVGFLENDMLRVLEASDYGSRERLSNSFPPAQLDDGDCQVTLLQNDLRRYTITGLQPHAKLSHIHKTALQDLPSAWQWLYVNVRRLAGQHDVSPASLCLVTGIELIAGTHLFPADANRTIPESLYFFEDISRDGPAAAPWGYWSLDADDLGNSSKGRFEDSGVHNHISHVQELNNLNFLTYSKTKITYVRLSKDESLLIEELEVSRTSESLPAARLEEV